MRGWCIIQDGSGLLRGPLPCARGQPDLPTTHIARQDFVTNSQDFPTPRSQSVDESLAYDSASYRVTILRNTIFPRCYPRSSPVLSPNPRLSVYLEGNCSGRGLHRCTRCVFEIIDPSPRIYRARLAAPLDCIIVGLPRMTRLCERPGERIVCLQTATLPSCSAMFILRSTDFHVTDRVVL
jgi:hypothetical protein